MNYLNKALSYCLNNSLVLSFYTTGKLIDWSDNRNCNKPNNKTYYDKNNRFNNCREIFRCIIDFILKVISKIGKRFIKLPCFFSNSNHSYGNKRHKFFVSFSQYLFN